MDYLREAFYALAYVMKLSHGMYERKICSNFSPDYTKSDNSAVFRFSGLVNWFIIAVNIATTLTMIFQARGEAMGTASHINS